MSILETLSTAPALISSAAEEVALKQKTLDLAKHNLEVVESVAALRYQDVAKNMKILESMITLEKDVGDHRIEVIEAKSACEIATIKHEKLYNEFLAARKAAGLQDAEWGSLRGSTVSHPRS